MRRSFVALLIAFTVAGCGDEPTGPARPEVPGLPNRAPEAVGTIPGVTLTAGDPAAQVEISGRFRDPDGDTLTHTAASSGPDVATASASGSTVTVTPVAAGEAEVTVTARDPDGLEAQSVFAVTVTENPDRAALVALYEAMDGPNWTDNENWLTDRPLGEWYGVDTDASGQVVSIDLKERWDYEARRWMPHGLAGPIPAELGNLPSLETLDLRGNDLSGPIPAELGNLASLVVLTLGRNALTGAIPAELGNLVHLGTLKLDYNALTGPIPPELGRLTNLERLTLASNALTGPIPAELGNLASLVVLSLGNNALAGAIPAELGNLAHLEHLWLPGNALTGPIPPELGRLTNLERLTLASNALTGPIPAELGNLASLERLYLNANALTGRIPPGFVKLERLKLFRIRGNDGLCVPGTSAFVAWLREIEDSPESESLCNAADVAALKLLYDATGGTSWIQSNGWTGDGAVEDWHGVRADSLGLVTALDLSRNGLTGRVPSGLGNLAEMTELRIGGNALTGRIPLGLAELTLQTFHYAGTELCAPVDASFRAWLNGIPSHEGTEVECSLLSDREILEILYSGAGGSNWVNAENWLTDAPLGEWYGVETDPESRVSRLLLESNALTGPIPAELASLASLSTLGLESNALTGPIPPELGNLASLRDLILSNNALTGPVPAELGNLTSLEWLYLSNNALTGPIPAELGSLVSLSALSLGGNALTGPIPAELGNLTSLEWLDLSNNALSAPIPAELGNLANLVYMWLGRNALTGPIPAELGNLTSLEWLYLSNNALSAPIPAELGNLANLVYMWLGRNALTGPIPPELGNLASLRDLILSNNALTGPVPAELGRMSSLRRLTLTNNSGMAGSLPTDLTALGQLEELMAGGTGLCVPSDPGSRAWLETVHRRRRIATCAGASMAYLTQTVQSREFPVPLVAGEKALLRVFPTTGGAIGKGIPPVRARFYVNGRETYAVEIPGTTVPIPAEVDEGSLSKSANAEIPGEIVRPGLAMVIEIDPEGTPDAGLGVARRIPETGRQAVDVREMPIFDLTAIPFLWTADPDSAILTLTAGMAADPEGHELLESTRILLPVGDLDVTAHEPVMSSSNNAYVLLDQARAIRAMEGGTGHYMGMMSGSVSGPSGLAEFGGRVSFALPGAELMAHELGHNMGLSHAPCGGAGGPDPSYPYPGGSIGAWGYDFRGGARLVPPGRPDLMGYCGPRWISDYHFTNALGFRLFNEGPPPPAVAARSLLLWGRVDADSVPYLEPAFVVDAPAALPDSTGEHRLTGRTASGGELFSLGFAMPEIADADGGSSFAFVLPVRLEWEGTLASITLEGPESSVTVDGNSNRPMAILRNPRSGQVRAILRDLPQAEAGAALAPQADGLDVLLSRGIPTGAAWRQ